MKLRSSRWMAVVAVAGSASLALAGCAGSGGGGASGGGGGDKSTISVVLSNMQDPFWQTVQCGMQKAAVEFADSINVDYYTTPTYDSAGIQSSFDAAKLTNPNGMFLQVVQPTQLVSETRSLMQSGVPVVGMSGQDPNQLLDVLNSDFDATPLVDAFLKSIPQNGKLAVIGGQATVTQVTERYTPLLDAVKSQRPDVTVLDTQYTDFDVTKATDIATAIFVGNPDLTNIIGSNGPDATGVYAAMKQNNIAPGKVNFWAWDANPDTVQALRDGYASHLYSQGAITKGYDAIKELKDTIASSTPGQPIEPKPEDQWYTQPLGDLTAANIDDPDMAQYLTVTTADCQYFNQ